MSVRVVVQTPQQNVLNDVFTWAGLTQASLDTGQPVNIANARALVAILVAGGTLGVGGAVQWEMSDDAGTTWYNCSSDVGTPANVSQTALSTPAMIKERGILIRPRVTGGDGTTTLSARLTVSR